MLVMMYNLREAPFNFVTFHKLKQTFEFSNDSAIKLRPLDQIVYSIKISALMHKFRFSGFA